MTKYNVISVSTSGFQIEQLYPEDQTRIDAIMQQYHDSEFDLVDLSLMAVSGRLNITQGCTFDRRDFTVFRPKHVARLQLIP